MALLVEQGQHAVIGSEISKTAKDSPAFRAAYHACILDLQAARGVKPETQPPQDDGWYLDERVKALSWTSEVGILAFILYTDVPFFYDDVDAEVLDIWVESTSRRRGGASELVRQAIAGIHGRVGLQVHVENAASLAFWSQVAEANGWEMTRELVEDAGEQVWKVTVATGQEPSKPME